MPRVPLWFTFAGRRDDSAHHAQPELSTPSARNVRARDPVTGRMTGARRAALTKWNPSLIGVGPVRALVSTAIDDRKLEYAFSSGAVLNEWFSAVKTIGESRNVVVDTQGNVYALDGNAGIVKFNSAGRVIMKITLPTAEAAHVVRALTVDEAGRIFAAVSEGGDVRTARMWCVLQLQDDQYFVVWTHEPGAYTEALKVYRGSQLFAAHNYSTEKRARVIVYESLQLEPTEVRRTEDVAYPCTGMDVGPDGSLYCSSTDAQLVNTDTGWRRTAPGMMTPLVGWKPTDDSTLDIHAWYDAREIEEADVEQLGAEATLEDNQQILLLRDKSGKNRHFYAGSLKLAGEKGPVLRKNGIGGMQCALFKNIGDEKNSMCTLGSPSTAESLRDQQLGALPAHVGGQFCFVMLIRPTVDDDVTTSRPRVVMAMDNQAATGSDHLLIVNRNAETALPGTYVQGSVAYYAETDNTGDAGGSGTVPPHLNEFPFATFPGASYSGGAMLVTVMWDGGVDPNDTTKTRCLVRINGRPVDRCEGLPFETLAETWLGKAPVAVLAAGDAVENRFQGEFAEMIVFRRKSALGGLATAEPKILSHDQYEPAVTADNTDQTNTQLARVEAYMAYGWGVGQILHGTGDGAIEVGYRNYNHYYARRTVTVGGGPDNYIVGGPPHPVTADRYDALGLVANTAALVSKHDPSGRVKWVWIWGTHPDGAASGGLGAGVVVRKVESDGKTHVWSMGNQPRNLNMGPQAAASVVDVRKVIDNGETFSGATADGAWDLNYSAGVTDNLYPKMAADEFGNLYVPALDHVSTPGVSALLVVSKDGAAGLGVVRYSTNFVGLNLPHAVAVPPDVLTPAYRDDLAEKIAAAMYVAANIGSTFDDPAVFKYRLVTATALATGSPRAITVLAVTEDDVRLVTATTNTIPSGGSAALDGTAQYVQALRAGDDIVILDGTRYLAYNLRTGVLAALASTSAGEIPPRGKLAMYWRHRLVIGCFADAPGNYAASRLGNIRDWNQRPGALPTGEQIQTSTQSFSGATTRAGEAEDSLVAMIPGGDDLGYFLCESRILRLTGDPQDGGSIHKITEQMGGVFGESWCKDAGGRMFFFGNKPPGLYQLLDGVEGDAAIVPLSRHTLEESEFKDIDFLTHRILLAWNPIDRGIHIFQVAWATSTLVDHWFWEEKTHRLVKQPPLWTDRFYEAGKQPTAVAYLGGDDTRGMLFGCADGYIRLWDPTADTDDGDPVDGFFTSKVTPPGGPSSEWHLRGIQVALANAQGGARVEVFGSEVADALGPIQEAFDIGPGLNDEQAVSVRAEHVFVRVRSAQAGRWAFGSAMVDVVAKGKAINDAG